MSDPGLQCYFHVAIGKELQGKFISCSGIVHELEMETYQEGGVNTGPHFLAANPVPQRLVLERGVVSSDQMAKWLETARTGAFTKLTGTIELRDSKGNTQHRWMIVDAYPVKYEGPSLNAMDDSVAVTRIEIMHRGILPEEGKAAQGKKR